MNVRKIQKLLLIYTYEKLERNNVKMFDCVIGGTYYDLEYDFKEHTQEENEDFLKEWKFANDIHLSEYKTIADTGKNVGYTEKGVPILVKLKNEGKN